MATNWIVKKKYLATILSIVLVQGCSSSFVDGVMKGATEATLGKDYIPGPEWAAGLGEHAKAIELCKEYLTPQQYGLFSSDVSWYLNYIDNSTEQEAYKNMYNRTTATPDECKNFLYDAEAIHNARLDQQRESLEFQNRRSQSSHTNCVETYNGLSCNTTPW